MGQKHLALLRGINVGGKNKILMKDLAALFVAAGASEVKTFIQSGNVVFDPGDQPEKVFEESFSRLAAHMGKDIPIVFRSREEVLATVGANPYLKNDPDENRLAVMFLRDFPTQEQAASLDPGRSLPDVYTIIGRDIYMEVLSFADTKLTNQYFDSRLKTVSTSRNWRTVKQLAELLD